jgi:AcrR family transcriptional regulator
MSPTDRPQSRRERPAKPPLSRAWIVSTTLDIVRREGLSKATMRRVAGELDTGPASL